MGDECPCGRSSFHTRLFSGPNSAGRFFAAEIPDPLGPRKRDHSSWGAAEAAVVAARPSATRSLSAILKGQYTLRRVLDSPARRVVRHGVHGDDGAARA